MVHTLDIVRIAFPNLDLAATEAHGTTTVKQQVVDVLAVRGEFHDACLAHANRIPRPARHKLLLVSRDHLNHKLHLKEGKLYSRSGMQPGHETNYTDVESGLTHIGFADLLETFESVTTRQELEESLSAKVAI
jgi:hypothetical protein